jgi:hypothetical protein
MVGIIPQINTTPVRRSSTINARRNLFKTVPSQFVCNGEGENVFLRPDFEVYQIRATESYIVNPGQTVRVKSNIVVMHSLGDPAGFFTLANQHPGYWLHKPCSAKFFMKEGVISTHHTGVIFVIVLNKSTDNVMIRQGTNLGCLQFNCFI